MDFKEELQRFQDSFLTTKSPHSISISLTDYCNLRCKFCRINQEDKKFKLDLKKIHNTLSEIKEVKTIEQIILTGGEPFIIENIIEIIKIFSDYQIGIVSNGTLIDENHAKKLSEIPNIWIKISIDSGEKTIVDEIRGKNVFEKIVLGVSHLSKYNIPISISTVLTKANQHSMESLFHFAKENLFESINFIRCVPLGQAKHNTYNYLSPIERKKVEIQIIKLTRKYKNLVISIDDPCAITLEEKIPKNLIIEPCFGCWGSIALNTNGIIYPTFHFPYKVGNLQLQSLKSIIKSKEYQNLISLNVITEGYCLDCKYYTKCYGGCRGHAAIINGMSSSDPECYYGLEALN